MSKITLIVPKEVDEFSEGVNAVRTLCLLAVKEELELPGKMPDDLFDKFKNVSNKEEMKDLLVKLIQLTKDNIINRINKVVKVVN